MISLTLQQIAQLTSGQVIHDTEPSLQISDYGTDSRVDLTGQLFIALKGEDFDGHDFIAGAIKQGAVAIMVMVKQAVDIPQVIVPDTLLALANLARHQRQHFAIPTIGLTGSCGKTTTKEMIAAILAESAEVHATRGNLNNEFGVPFTLFELDEHHQYSVIEMGAGGPGDIDYLSKIALPDVVLITCIAEAHLERLGSLAGVAETKGGILHGLSASGMAVLPLDKRWLDDWQKKLGKDQRLLTFGLTEEADLYASDIQTGPDALQFKVHFQGQATSITLPLQGEHNVVNALAAIGSCCALGISLSQCAKGLANVQSTSGRLTYTTGLNGCQILDDTYNANPAAMVAGARVLAQYPGYHLMIIGDMAELGEESTEIHHRVGTELAALDIDELLAVGELSSHLVAGFGAKARHFDSKNSLLDYLIPKLGPDWVVLVKGSRSAGMEDIVERIKVNKNGAAKAEEAVSC